MSLKVRRRRRIVLPSGTFKNFLLILVLTVWPILCEVFDAYIPGEANPLPVFHSLYNSKMLLKNK
jgi:hypothetical protein